MTYGTIITDAGAVLMTAHLVNGTKLHIIEAAAGDGGPYEPTTDQTALVHERWRGAIVSAEQNAAAPNMIDIKFVLGADTGGFVIRELGLFSEDGTLVAVCNTPEIEKTVDGGVSDRLTVLMHLVVKDASVLTFNITPSLDMVSREETAAMLTAHDQAEMAHPDLQSRLKNLEDSKSTNGNTDPTGSTPGIPGQHYLNTETGEEFVCTKAEDGAYTWVSTSETAKQALAAANDAASAAQAAKSNSFHLTFEPEDWTGTALRVPASRHKLDPRQSACISVVRARIDRTAQDYLSSTAASGQTAIINAMKAAISANTATPGTYPVAGDGHVQLTWAQVQRYILEGSLAANSTAVSQANSKGYNWQNVDTTGTPETVTLDALLAAAYVPALGGSTAAFNALCTAEVLQGLRLRRKADGVGTVSKYDLEGQFVLGTWSVLESRVYWDMATKDLVLESGAAFAGDLMAMA